MVNHLASISENIAELEAIPQNTPNPPHKQSLLTNEATPHSKMYLGIILTCTLAIFGMSTHAIPTQGTDPAVYQEPDSHPQYPRTDAYSPQMSEREFSALTSRSDTLASRDFWRVCNYIWMGTAPFCAGSCKDIPGVEGSPVEEIVRLDHTLPCPTNTNSGAERIGNLQECRRSEGKRCWTGTKVFCRYGCESLGN